MNGEHALHGYANRDLRGKLVASVLRFKDGPKNSPSLWAHPHSETGFGQATVRRLSLNSLRSPGQFLLGNRVASFFLTSHLRLLMRRMQGWPVHRNASLMPGTFHAIMFSCVSPGRA